MRAGRRVPGFLFCLPWMLSSRGGVNQVVLNLAREMRRSGTFEPTVLVADWNAPDPVSDVAEGVPIIRWRLRPFYPAFDWRRRVAYGVWELGFRRRFARLCEERGVVAVNPHFPTNSLFAIAGAVDRMHSGISLIVSFHGADLTDAQAGDAAMRAAWSALLRSANAVVSCSDHLAMQVSSTFGPGFESVAIHNGVDADAFVSSASDLAFPDGTLIASVATFEHKKGQDVLVEAFARIADTYPHARLALMGASEALLPELRTRCRELGVADRVHFFPDASHRDVAALLRAAALFALPSRREPFGIVVLEAGTFGLPVVASRVGGVPEIVRDGDSGLLVPPDDPDALARGVSAMLDRPEEARRMGARLRSRVVAEFSWRHAVERYTALVPTHGSCRPRVTLVES